MAEQERAGRPAKAELSGQAGLDVCSANAYGFIPDFARFIQTPGLPELKELIL